MKYAVPIFLLLFCILLIFAPIQAQFTETNVDFIITEESLAGQLIGRVPLDPNRRYRLNGNASQLVAFDPNTGELHTTARIDREQVARLDLVLVAQPAAIITVAVKVADVNDNAPTFPSAVQNLSIVESAAVGSRLVIQSAVDADDGKNGTITAYSISGESMQNLFRLVRQEDVLFLELMDELDREDRDLYVINVTAKDGGDPARSGSTTVYINVIDANDNSPIFNSSHYEVEISEDVSFSSPILTVRASDSDLGDNAMISYRIINDPQHQFVINSQTGEITVVAETLNCSRSACERENCTRMCVFTVEAEDSGSPKLTGRAFVDVKIVDSNLHEPEIVFKLHPIGIDYCSVLEKSLAGSTIAVITVIDKDFGENGRADINIVSGNDEELFRLESGTNFAILRLKSTLDVKKRDRYLLEFEASDNGKPRKFSRKSLKIYVRSTDDKPPSLGNKTVYYATVSENSPIGTVVSFVRAKSEFSPLSYTVISGNEDGIFDLDEYSGLITLAKASQPREFHLNLTVKNPTPSVMFTNYSIHINVIDANRHAPRFDQDVYQFTISEASNLGSRIGFLRASDQDRAHNGQVSYRILQGTVAAINSSTGELTLAENLDFEKTQSYSIQAAAFDHGEPLKETTVTVGITVTDANDNSPYFDIDKHVAIVRLLDPVGKRLVQVQAKDQDLEDYGRLLYRILSAPVALFDIENDGWLTLRGQAESLRTGTTVEVVVGAVDRGSHGSSNNATVTLTVLDDMATVDAFQDTNWHPKVYENGVANEIIGKYSSTGSSLSRLVGIKAQKYLQLDSNGNLKTRVGLDREEVDLIEFAIMCGSVMKRGTVAVLDKNDNAPKFASDKTKFVVHETATIGEEIGRITAVDLDSGLNGDIRYETDSDAVVVDSKTGVLFVRKRISNDKDLQVTVTAKDYGSPSLSSSVKVTVKVDNSTKMHSFAKFHVYRIPENTEIGTVIGSLNPQNLVDRYAFYSTRMWHNSKIGIFPNGDIFVRRSIDREETDTVSLEIGVQDRLRNNRYRTSVTVYIDDRNDNRPQCPTQTKLFVPENTEILSIIGDLSGTDQDQGLNGLLSYKLLNHDQKFLLDKRLGTLRNLIPLDFESKTNSYQLRYQVSDYGSPSLSTQCAITIILTDVNDHAPRFCQPVYYTRKDRILVDAKDPDFGPLTYSMIDWYSKFQINPTTGLVSASVPLTPGFLYNVTVIASDAGELPMQANVTVIFEPEKTSDNLRFYEDLPERITVPEDAVIGTKLLEIKANFPVYLSKDSHFELEPYDGDLILVKPLDYEKYRNHTVSINQKHEILIEVTNVNDNAPEIETDFIRVSENQNIHEEIRVSDADNDQVTVFLYETGEEGLFRLQNGFLISDRNLDREQNDQYQLLVVAIDNGSPPQKTQKVITVVVADENDNEPACLGTSAFVEGKGEMRLICEDQDFGINASLGFSSSGAVYVDQDGVLRPNSPLQEPVYNFFVNVFDRNTVEGSNSIDLYRKTVQVPVTLIRYNPTGHLRFKASSVGLTLNRSSSLHTEIGRIKVSQGVDPIEFFITKFSSKPRFVALPLDVDRKSGHLRVSRKIDLELDEVTLEVTAVDAHGSTDSVQVNIRIINDDPGVFTLPHNSYYFEILESAAVKSTIGQISIVGKPSHLKYGFKPLTLSDFPFSINDKTGMICLDRRLAYAKTSNYRTTVSIISSTLSVVVPVFINILPAENEPPRFNDHKKSLFIREGLPVGAFIGQVTVNYGSQRRYELMGAEEKVSVDSITGLLTSNMTFDREKQSLYQFTVIAKDGYGNKASQHVDLYVDDVNDNTPKFYQKKYSIHLSEDTKTGTKILKMNFEDADLDNDFRFAVATSGNEYCIFDVDQNGYLLLAKPLDREAQNIHRITLILEDHVAPNPVHRVETTVEITVLDVNDNAPEFSKNLVFTVFTNAREDTVVGTVTAEDPDLGINGLVNFRLLPETHPEQTFNVDPLFGYIQIIKTPTQAQYHFTVEAFDNGTPRLRSQANVTIITVDYVSESYSNHTTGEVRVTVTEDAAVGHFVTQILGREGDIFRIQGGNELGHFRIHPESGCVFVSQGLNFEAVKEYNLKISDKVTIRITVTDVNDEYPVFIDGEPVRFTVAENIAGPYPIVLGSTIAEDSDTGLNGEVAYSILQGDTDLFGINSRSGLLYLNKGLDREDQTEYEITVQATDLGTPRLSSTAEVVVTVVDVNDNAPVFEQPYYVADISENLPPGQEVVQVRAKDKDAGVNAKIRYTLLNEAAIPFAINHTTGLLTTTESLDRERKSSYNLQITATDNGVVYQHSTVTNLTVDVLDVNDNSPVILNKQFDVFVPVSLRRGEFVYAIDAVDNDADQNLCYTLTGGSERPLFNIDQDGGIWTSNFFTSKLVYSILVTVSDSGDRNTTVSLSFYTAEDKLFPRFKSFKTNYSIPEDAKDQLLLQTQTESARVVYSIAAGDPFEDFEIDPLSGTIIVRKVDRETKAFYRLFIGASYPDSTTHMSYKEVTVAVEDLNDNRPKFEKVLYKTKIFENEMSPYKLVKVKATDKDIGENAKISYRIMDGNFGSRFFIDENGQITVSESLDREEQASYRLTIKAYNPNSPTQNQIAIVEVTVEDENDNSPKFTRLFHAEVAEDSAVGTFVVQVTSTDPDGSKNSLNRYTLEGEDSDVFNIDPDSGNVTLSKPVDRETKDEYRVRVKASDGFWQVATTLTITVTDINDNAPKFVKEINEFSVHRDTPTGSPVHQVSALDIDSGFNSQVQYQFLEDSRSFRIDPKTGLIYSTLPLKNNPEIMTLKVVAEDMGIPSLSATVTLRIFVVGDNVHVPEFTENDYKFPINARIPKGTVIGQVQATDADVKRPGMVRYALTSSKGDFRINETTGEITYLSGPLTNQDLSVKAYDLGAPPKVATVTVKIVAVDKATKEPEFVKKIYNFYAGETMKVEAKSDDELWYSLKSSTVPFTIDSRSGIITPKTVLSGNHSFTVITESLGWPKFTSKALVRVYSNAKNAPIRNIKLKLSEATRIGNVVTKVEGSGSYSVQPGPFTVDTVTGEIRLVQALERKVYSIYVTGPEVTLLEVIVIKAQKLQPKFLSCPSDTVYLSKKSYNSTVIAQPNADTIDGFPLQYSALSELATIDSESGLLKLRSLKDAFNVTVMVSSGRLRSTVPDHCTLKFETVNLAPTPIFNKTNYHASIPENAVNGTIVLDLDMAVPQDARLKILSGNKDKCFCLDPSGKLTVCGLLDREMNDNYSMEIAVTVKEDIRSLTVVQVTVEDVNDNPPYLEEGNSIAYVLENTKPGTKILSLKPKDMDLPLNQGHFSYNIQSDFFAITEEGVISTKISFDREKRSLHLVPIQISDYGSPRKTASIVVKVVIDDQDDNLPSPGPVKIHIATSLDTYAGVILKAGPRDVDTIDYSLCRLAQPSNQFNYSSACSLDMSKVKTSSSYELKAKTHRNLEFPISVHFYRIQEYHKMEAVTVTLDAVDQTMADLVASLQEALPDMRVVLTGATVTPTYRNRLFLAFIDRNDNVVSGLESVEIVKNHLKKKSTIREATVDYRSCSKNCLNLGKCERSQEEKDTVELRGFASAWIVPQIHVVERCVCPKLVKGEFCEQSQPSCAEKSSGGCRNQGICDTSKAVCICPKGFKGVYCEKDVDECAQKGTCPSTSVCQNLLGSYQCICKPGYSGKNCETKAKTCEPINTICHRGSCNEDKCVCEPGWTGKSCDQKLLSFGAGSYIEMSKLDQLTSISFQITMRHAVGLIFYSFDPRDSTRFMAVDVAGGRLRFSQNLTRNGYSNTILDAPLDSGNWNKVSLVHSGTPYSSGTISLSVDTCDPETSICKRCQTAACKTTIYLSQEAFIVPDNGLIFGGARDLSDVSRLSQKVTSDYFEGCLRNLRINEKPLDAFANSQVGLLDFCPLVEKPDYCRNKDSCSGGVCTSEWNGSKCLCDGFEANNCVLAMEPVTFEDAGIRYALSKNMKQKVAFTPSDILVSGEDCKEDERREEAEGSQEGEFDDENVSTQAVEIDFKTPMQNAVIFTVLYRPKTATLQIRNGTLRYAIHYNERLLFEITNDFVFVSDNKWHRALVDVSRNGQTVRLTLDGHNTTSHSGFAYPQIISASIDSLTLGGGFSGCMRRFVVFDQAQPLINRLDARLPLQYLDQIGRTGGPVRTGCDEAKSDVEFFQGGYTYAFGGFLLLLLIVLILVIVAYLKFTKPPVQKPKRITTDCVRTIDSLFQNSGICNYNDAFDILSTTTTHRADSLPHIYETPPEAPVSKRHSKVPKMGTSPMNTVLPHRNSARQLKQAVRESAASARNASIPATTSESESESFGTRSRSRSRRSKRRPMTSASTATNSTLTTSLPSASSAIPIGQAYVRESDGYDAVSNSSSDYMRPRSLPVPQEHCRVQYL